MAEKQFLTAKDVAEYMGIAVPTAYVIIRKLNNELRETGCITIAGKINRDYFIERINKKKENGHG